MKSAETFTICGLIAATQPAATSAVATRRAGRSASAGQCQAKEQAQEKIDGGDVGHGEMGEDKALEKGLAAEGLPSHCAQGVARQSAGRQHSHRLREVFFQVIVKVERLGRQQGGRHEAAEQKGRNRGGPVGPIRSAPAAGRRPKGGGHQAKADERNGVELRWIRDPRQIEKTPEEEHGPEAHGHGQRRSQRRSACCAPCALPPSPKRAAREHRRQSGSQQLDHPVVIRGRSESGHLP